MINIKDVSKKRKAVPEPVEVDIYRRLINDQFKGLVFEEGPHKYYLKDDNGKTMEMMSVSHFTHGFVKEDDWDEIAARYAVKHDMEVDDVKKMWHENNITSTSRGSITHFYGEMLMNLLIGNEDVVKENMKMQYQDGYLIPYCAKEEAIMKYYTDILNNDNVFPIMPETKVHTYVGEGKSFRQGVAGTFDIALAMRTKGKIGVCIHDFKTNKDLYNDFSRTKGKMLLPPFDDFFEEPFSLYTLQLSMYQLMLERLGIEVIDRRLIWLKDDGTYEKIKTENMVERLRAVLSSK